VDETGRGRQMKLLVLVLAIVFFPRVAYAYVDPGFLSILFQLVYVFIFGTLATLIFKPWRYIKSLFKTSSSKKESESENESQERDITD
jgi:nitrate reductase NapE component